MFNLKKKLNAIMPGEVRIRIARLRSGLITNVSGHSRRTPECVDGRLVRTQDCIGGSAGIGRVPEQRGGDERDGRRRLRPVDRRRRGESFARACLCARTQSDTQDEIYQQNRGHFNQPRHRGQYIDEVPPPLPPKPVSSSSSYSSSQQYATHDRRHKSKNPFTLAEEDSSSGFEPRELSKPHHKSYDGYAGRQQDLLSFEDETPRGWSTFSEPSRGNQAALDPWAGRGWGTGNGQGQTSPTSSTGSGTSTVPSVEDPFRN